jgi:hypothetical protein
MNMKKLFLSSEQTGLRENRMAVLAARGGSATGLLYFHHGLLEVLYPKTTESGWGWNLDSEYKKPIPESDFGTAANHTCPDRGNRDIK